MFTSCSLQCSTLLTTAARFPLTSFPYRLPSLRRPRDMLPPRCTMVFALVISYAPHLTRFAAVAAHAQPSSVRKQADQPYQAAHGILDKYARLLFSNGYVFAQHDTLHCNTAQSNYAAHIKRHAYRTIFTTRTIFCEL